MQNYRYDWWSNHTLYKREKVILGSNVAEIFSYDSLNRLDSAIADFSSGTRILNYDYDALGNILYKKDSSGAYQVDHYKYTSSYKPYRLNSAVINGINHEYSYDESGNIIRDDAPGLENDRNIIYNTLGKPELIIKGDVSNPSAKNKFEYGPDGKRFYKETLNNRIGIVLLDGITIIWPRPTIDKTIYLYGGEYELVIPAEGGVERIEKTYLGDIQHTLEVNDIRSIDYFEYFHTDHLGSIDAITDEDGKLVAQNYFDPFGTRRSANWSSGASAPTFNFQNRYTNKGFTGHEHLDDTGLIHMNGRVYEPILGRFISPDTWIQDPKNSQSFNRYSYVWNNPLQYTDPTGELVFLAAPAIAKGVGAVVSLYGAWQTGQAIGNGINDLAAGEKSVGQIAQELAVDVAINAALSASGAGVVKVVDKVAPNATEKLVDEGKKAINKVSGNGGNAEKNVTNVDNKAKFLDEKIADSASSSVDTTGTAELTKSQSKGIKSLEKQIKKHQQKLDDFKSNPTVRPGMENLPEDVIKKQQETRIKHLEKEINTFKKNNIEKIKKEES